MLFFKDRASTAWAASDSKTYLEQYHFIVFCSLLSREKYPSYAIIVGTMDVFISWSGERSGAVAKALRDWLPKIINALRPWLSSADIDKGTRWSTDVASRLQAAKAGIICLTPSNIHSDWILFEAGALSKTLENTFVCPLLIGLDPADVQGPLAQFQATRAAKEDVLRLLKTLNSALGDNALPDAHIEEAFDVWWPKLESQIKSPPQETSKSKPHRSDRELLEEVLALLRNQNRSSEASSAEAMSERQKRNRITLINRELMEFVRPAAEAGTEVSLHDTGSSLVCTFRPEKGDGYKIEIPINTPVTDIRELIQSQIPIVSKPPSGS